MGKGMVQLDLDSDSKLEGGKEGYVRMLWWSEGVLPLLRDKRSRGTDLIARLSLSPSPQPFLGLLPWQGFEIDSFEVDIPPSMMTSEGFFRSLPQRDGIDGAFAARLRRIA